MLTGQPTRYGAGIALFGDPTDLAQLRDTLYDLADEETLGPEVAGLLLALAYDVRHALMGDRLEQEFGISDMMRVIYRGVQVLWPYFLVQVGLLRHAASFRPTTAANQADLYRLEAVARDALLAYDGSVGLACWDLVLPVGRLAPDYLVSFVEVQARAYVRGPGGKQRFRRLPTILEGLLAMRSDYCGYRAEVESLAERHGCRAQDMGPAGDFPDFRW